MARSAALNFALLVAAAACSSSSATTVGDGGSGDGGETGSTCPSPTGTYSLLMTLDLQGAGSCTGADAMIMMQVMASGAVTITGAPQATFPGGATVGPPSRCAVAPPFCLGGCPSATDSTFIVVCDGGPPMGEQFNLCVDGAGNVVSHEGTLIDVDYGDGCDWHLSGRRTGGE